MITDRKVRRIVLCWMGGLAIGATSPIACVNNIEDGNEGHVQTILPGDSSQVSVMVLESTDFSHELVSNGILTATDRADLRFETPDVVEEIYVRNGQHVIKGQKIAALSRFKLQNAVGQAHDNLEKSKLELQDVLISQGYAIKDSALVPPGIMKIARIKSNYEHSVIQYELAQYNLDKAVLHAPFDGVVANLFSKKYNMPPGTDPFCTVISSQLLEADFNVLESELALIRAGDRIQLSPFALSDYSVSGTVHEINPVVDQHGMVRIKARITSAAGKLYDGMNVKVTVKRALGKQLIIPKAALVLRNNRKVVFTAKNGKAMWNYVQTGLENSAGYVVTEGLTAGDSVIFSGNLNLAHETPIQLER